MLVVERTKELNLNRVEWRKRIYVATLDIQDKGLVVVLPHANRVSDHVATSNHFSNQCIQGDLCDVSGMSLRG